MKQVIRWVVHIAMIIVLMFSAHPISFANHSADEVSNQEWDKINKLADEALFLLGKEEFEATKKRIQDISTLFLSLDTSKYLERVEQVHILLGTVVEAKEALNAVNLDINQAKVKLMKMKLAIDAVSHHKQPLWLNYYPAVAKTISDLFYALEQDNRDLFYLSLNKIQSQYELVRPAMYISHSVGVVEQLDSLLTFLAENKEQVWKDKDQAVELIQTLERQMKLAFFQKVNNNMQSFAILLMGMGTFIGLALTYAAWRKYKGENEKRPVPRRNNFVN